MAFIKHVLTDPDASGRLQPRLRFAKFAILAIQLGLILVISRQFQLESSAFIKLLLLAFGGFAIHSFLALQYRLPFFLLLSLAGIGVILGISNGLWLVGLSIILIGICHLPVRISIRICLLILSGGLLAVLRAGWFWAPWPNAIWPILGSIFMFRLMIYVYDLRHEKGQHPPLYSLSYFLLLPNVCFPLFPVVDYKAFRRNHYNDEPCRIYQTGVDWMLRGIIHLLLYRLIYQYLTISPSEVTTVKTLAQYLITNFLLYLRVSGQFHFAIGMLHLFGFNLPETNHHYLFASSFTDFWRRINIYWKDFMMKIFYYPIYFKLRTWGTTKALTISTILVFIITWFLHSYQWFWLRGNFTLAWQDACFWGVLGLLVLVNVLHEARHSKTKSLGQIQLTWPGIVLRSIRIAGTLAMICVLWSLWTSESLSSWISLWAPLATSRSLLGIMLSILIIIMAIVWCRRKRMEKPSPIKTWPNPGNYRGAWTTVTLLVLLSLLGIPSVYSHFGAATANFILSVRSGKLSRLDNARLEKGYYEELLRVDRFSSQLWEVYAKKPLHWLDVGGTGLERFRGDFLQKELAPSFRSLTSYGAVQTNRWGMRDKDYSKEPGLNSYRIGLLGASSVMGWGVHDDQTFESIVEDRLNANDAEKPYGNYEILNFGVPGYQPPQQLMVLNKVFEFKVNSVFYVATGREADNSVRYVAEAVRKQIRIPFPFLESIVQRAQLNSQMSEDVIMRKLAPYRYEMLSLSYRYIVQECKKRQVMPVCVQVPMIREDPWQDDIANQLRIAEEAGFIIFNLIDVFKNQDLASLRLADWDTHPNAQGHRLIAAQLYASIKSQRTALFPKKSTDSGQ